MGLEVISIGISRKFSNFEALILLTPNSIEIIKVTESAFQFYTSEQQNDMRKMLVKGDSVFLKSDGRLQHFKLIETDGEITIHPQNGVPNNPIFSTDFNEICVWNVEDSEVLITFASLKMQGNVVDVIIPQVLSGSIRVKEKTIVPNIGSTTAFFNDVEKMTLITGNFEGKLYFWNLIDVSEGYEVMKIREIDFPEQKINFISKTSGKNSLILGTQMGDVLIVDYKMHCTLFNIRFDAEIHYIIEEKTRHEAFLRVAGKDPQFLIKMSIDKGICKLLYEDFEAAPSPPAFAALGHSEGGEKKAKKKKDKKKRKKKKKKDKKKKKKSPKEEQPSEKAEGNSEGGEGRAQSEEERQAQLGEEAKQAFEKLQAQQR